MTYRLFTALVLVFTTLAACIGCKAAEPERVSPSHLSDNPLTLTISLKNPEVPLGSEIIMDLSLKNTGDSPITLKALKYSALYSWFINGVHARHRTFKDDIENEYVLGPGDTWEHSMSLNDLMRFYLNDRPVVKIDDMHNSTNDDKIWTESSFLKPGEYSLQVFLHDTNLGHDPLRYIPSNEVVLKITESETPKH